MKNDLIFHDIEQGSEEWFILRRGKLTGSAAGALLVNGKKKFTINSGEFAGEEIGIGVGAISLIYKLAGERIAIDDMPSFDNYATQRGHDLEPLAIKAYEDATYQTVDRIGFVQLNDYVGFSPDGLVTDELGIEIKCLMHSEHMRVIDNLDYFDNDHIAQIHFMMTVADLKHFDLVHFHPEFNKNKIIIRRIERDESIVLRIRKCIALFEQEVSRLVALDHEPNLVVV